MDRLASTVYTQSANVGSFEATVSLIVSIVVGVILFLCGIGFIVENDWDDVTATVSNNTCQNIIQAGKTTQSCQTTVQYTISGKNYTNNLQTSATYVDGQKINIQYETSNPNNIRISGTNNNVIGIFSSCVALIIIGGAYFNYYMTTHYKTYAAIEGVDAIYNMV